MAESLIASVCPRCGSTVLAGATAGGEVQLLDPAWPTYTVAEGEAYLVVVATAYALHRCVSKFAMG